MIRLVRGLEARGHQVRLALVPGDRFEAKAREAGIEPVAGLSLDVKSAPWAWTRDVARLRALVRRDAVDVIHTHHSHDHWLGALSRGGAALARTFHNQRAVKRGPLRRALYRRTDAVLVVSRQIEDRCRLAGIRPERIFRVSGVIDLLRFTEHADPARVRGELGLDGSAPSGPVIGTVARLAHNRGHELLIRGFRRLLPRYPQLGLEREILFTGYRDADLPAVLHALDTFVLMGAGSDESCRAALEAMAAGRPVVARRVGAMPEAVEHGVTGLLVDDERPESVEAALGALAGDPERARRMGEAGRRRAVETFSPEHHAEEVEAIYLEILARRGRSS